TATNASFVSGPRNHPPERPARPTTPAGGATSASSRSNGPSKPSRIRANWTPIWYASVQPATSYGGVGGAPGYLKSFGWSCGSNMSSTYGRNACAVFTTYEPAGYRFPFTVNGAVARCTVIPARISAFTNFVAVREAGWAAGRR